MHRRRRPLTDWARLGLLQESDELAWHRIPITMQAPSSAGSRSVGNRPVTHPSRDDRNQQLLSDFFDNAAVGLHWQAEDGTIQRANRALADLLGYQPADLVGRNILEFHADRQLGARTLGQLRRGETVSSVQARLVTRSGESRWALVTANVLWEQGRFVHARCFTRDVTNLQVAQHALEEADRRKAAILEASLDAIITMDAQGRVVDFNQAAERIFGHPRQQAVGQILSELIIPEHLRSAHAEGLRRYLETGVGPVLGRRIEVSALHAQGHEFPVELSIATVDGAVPLFTATLRDISARRRAESDLNAAVEALRASEAALRDEARRKDEFIATLSHELRNPLAPIRTSAELLTFAGLAPQQREHAVQVILRQTRSMSRLLDDLLDVARLTRGKLTIRRQQVDLQSVIASASEVARSSVAEKRQHLRLELPSEPVLVEADPVRLAQVVSNLLINASKYSGPDTTIDVNLSTGQGWLRLDVVDQGMGIAPEHMERLFQMFSQLPGQAGEPASGLGIGLALSKALVEMHGGRLEASSGGLGKGATFSVLLPLS